MKSSPKPVNFQVVFYAQIKEKNLKHTFNKDVFSLL